ncbi:MAG TPA: efflux RND transporter periplasmic adaptor subunit [Herbaspirillum sp.]|jgi:multidrug efflux system membrane fusion protein|nr:efflux RND transporter periplasmic adaptor subunit [Herbaspirillum sp.]
MTTSSPAKRSNLLIGAALVALLGAGWYFTHRSAPQPVAAPPAVSVTTALVKSQDVPLYVVGVGTVTANASVLVKTRVDGQLVKVGFTEGQDVKAGQMLAELDPRTLQAQLAQAQAQKSKDQASLGNAKIDLQRYTTLLAQDAATQQQLDTQKALVAQLIAAVQTDEAQVNFAQVQLSFTTINAPLSGRVGVRLVDPGNIVHATDANGVVVINQIDPITVLFTLPEESVPAINHAQLTGAALNVVAAPRDSDQALATGKLIVLNNQIDTTNGTVQLKARFANAQHQLWPGQYVNVKLLLKDSEPALTLPSSAIQRNQDGTYVYLVGADETTQIVPVQVARIQDGIAVIAKGLDAGQRVVIDGQYKLKPGAHIREQQTQQIQPAAPAAKGSAK